MSGVALWVSLGLAAYVVFGAPWLGRYAVARSADRVGFFRATLLMQVTWVALVLVVAACGVDVGLGWPRWPGVLVAGTAIVLVWWRPALMDALAPRTVREARYARAAAVGAGIAEEMVYRGLLIAVGTEVFGMPRLAATATAGVVFVLGHLYQDTAGLLTVAGLTVVFSGAYLLTGGVLVPVFLHAATDLRAFSGGRSRGCDPRPGGRGGR